MSRRAPPRQVVAGAAIPVKANSARVPAVDSLRGLAVLAMVLYHFCFDLRYYQFTSWNFYHGPFWLAARTVILSSFLLLAGISLVLAERNRGSGRQLFWRHIGRIALCAVIVSAGSYWLFPQSFIWFGVLHAIALSLILARPLVTRPALAAGIGVVMIVAGNYFAHPVFDQRALGWLGFMTAKPQTEDYVPLFPWTGVLLLGVAVGVALARAGFRPVAAAASMPRLVHWLGRHSLAVYMLHQPLLLGLLGVLAMLVKH